MNDCVFNYEGKCRVLCRNNCIGCSFKKTEAQLKAGREKALKRISYLPANKREHILHTYYKGKIKGVVADW